MDEVKALFDQANSILGFRITDTMFSGTADELKLMTETEPNRVIQWQRPINLYRIHNLFRPHDMLSDLYSKNQNNYKALKEALIEDLEKFIAPMREVRASISDEKVKEILAAGGTKAREHAATTMKIVREKVGVSL